MGYPIHPSLRVTPKEQSHYPELKNNDYGEKFAIFMNHKIDAITIKLFGFLISVYKINSLKISSNDLSLEAEEIQKIL